MTLINCKYTEYLIVPANAISSDEVVTADGINCRLVYQSTWNNEKGQYDWALDDACHRYYQCPFSTIREIWFSRLGKLDTYWHLVKMVKL